MDHWKLITVMVTVFTFTVEIRPMDSFLTAYLTGPSVNVSLNEVSNVFTPIRIYFGVIGSFLVFLLSDYLRYKPVMIFNGVLGMVAYINLIDSPTAFQIMVTEVCFSLFACIEMAYYGYLYSKIEDKEHYQIATGFAKSGMLSGTCVAGLLGQLAVYFNDRNYSVLPYYSLAFVTFATVWACFLPSVGNSKTSIQVDDVGEDDFSNTAIQDPSIPDYSSTRKSDTSNVVPSTVFVNRFCDFRHSYADRTVLMWSIWYVVAMAGFTQTNLYVNILYTYIVDVSDDKHALLNGLVDSLATMCAAISAYQIGKVNVNWSYHGFTFLTFSSLVLALLLSLGYYSTNIFVVYFMYICFDTVVQSVFVIAMSQIAKQLKHDFYTSVLGFNAFLGIVLSTCLSSLLVRIETSLPFRFLVYSSTFIILGVVYGCAAVILTAKDKASARRYYSRLP
ncbi:thiamine transporter 2-like [Rhopalosiphum maidis]|uniref:thiamine transporter 2-like n=1 Tax=Rhopalosiphum maidis TaxID=43146 RepID=UPI000EFE009B|nr:thiamine transporter 2-like [Rhopalosiphum maidis]